MFLETFEMNKKLLKEICNLRRKKKKKLRNLCWRTKLGDRCYYVKRCKVSDFKSYEQNQTSKSRKRYLIRFSKSSL